MLLNMHDSLRTVITAKANLIALHFMGQISFQRATHNMSLLTERQHVGNQTK